MGREPWREEWGRSTRDERGLRRGRRQARRPTKPSGFTQNISENISNQQPLLQANTTHFIEQNREKWAATAPNHIQPNTPKRRAKPAAQHSQTEPGRPTDSPKIEPSTAARIRPAQETERAKQGETATWQGSIGKMPPGKVDIKCTLMASQPSPIGPNIAAIKGPKQ